MKPLHKALLSSALGILLVVGMIYFLRTGTVNAQSAPGSSEVIQAGLAYLKAQQQVDGGITGFSGVSDPDTTARSILAIISANEPISSVVAAGGKSMLDYLAAQAITYTHDTTGTLFPGRAGILLSAVSVAGVDPSTFGGMDIPGELEASFQTATGAYSTTAKAEYSSGAASDLSQAWVILGLSLAGRSVPDQAVSYLVESQAADGSWGGGDPDTTALALTALLTSGKVTKESGAVQKVIEYFHNTQAPSGGWKPSWDTDPLNADSTGWVIEALVSAGEDVSGQSWSTQQANPLEALMSLQKLDGSIGGSYANAYSTAEAIIGLSGVPLANFTLSAPTQRAGLAVFYGDNSYYSACVSFTTNPLSGLELLERSGLNIETATNPNQGTAVCKIGEVGSPSADCFGSMPDYWSYWQLGTNGWDYSVKGADQSQVVDGGVNAWTWGTGNSPPNITFQNICEGVAFVMPTSSVTTIPPTITGEPSAITTVVVTLESAQPSVTPAQGQGSVSNYLIYVLLLLGMAVLILVLFRSRRK